MDKANRQSGGDSWNTYWEGTSSIGAYTGGGVSHPAVTRFWNDFFAANPTSEYTPMLDIATGNGSVVDVAVSGYDFPATEISCVDISPAAVAVVQSRFPGVGALVADAAHLPFGQGQFSLVASQFGIEYAGRGAIFSACEQVAAQGTLALLLHCLDSSIYHESAVNLAAVSRLRETGFIPLAADFFEKGFAAVRGADRAPYDEAGTERLWTTGCRRRHCAPVRRCGQDSRRPPTVRSR
jgi:SAM-dependent methyltransferase